MDAPQPLAIDGEPRPVGCPCLRPLAECALEGDYVQTAEDWKTTCNVETDGVAERVNPKSRNTTGGCSRPHWPMAYKLRAPESIAAVASARMAASECRRPCRPRVSGRAAKTASSPGPSSSASSTPA